MNYNRNSLENLKDLYTSVHTTKKDQFLSEGVEVEEGFKEIDRDKENRMYRRAGNLARQSLASKGKKKYEAAKKSANIVGAITRQKENERFAKMADEKARDNYNEAFVDPEKGEAPSGRTPLENVSDHPKASVRRKAVKGMRKQMEKEYGGNWKSRSNDPVKEEIEYTNNYRENFYDVVCDYIISEGFASDVDGANQVILKLDDQVMLDIYEAKMTAAHKEKESKLKDKYDDSEMKQNMIKQYGKEEGKKIYFATIRKQAMESFRIDSEKHKEAQRTAEREDKLRKRAKSGDQGSEIAAKKIKGPKLVGEAVYGGGKKKEEPKDTRKVVTRADKLGNTKAYQNYKAGDPRYKAADHLGETVEVEIGEATKLFYKLQAKGKGRSSTAKAQTTRDSNLEDQKSAKMRRQQAKQRMEREPEDKYGHPSLSAAERNPSMR